MQYHLSNRQRSALFVRCETLPLALLPPFPTPVDPLTFARSVLPVDVAERVASAVETTLVVYAMRPGCGPGEKQTLTHHLGVIVPDDSPDLTRPDMPIQRVPVILALCVPTAPAGKTLPVQWPVSLVMGQRRFPGAD